MNIKPGQLGRFEAKLAKSFRTENVTPFLQHAGNEICLMLEAKSAQVSYRDVYRRGWFAKVFKKTLHIGNDAPHWYYVEHGRRPGRMPPINVIREWTIFRGMGANAAFPVARAIGQRGVRGRPLIITAPIQMAMARIVQKWLARVNVNAFRGGGHR